MEGGVRLGEGLKCCVLCDGGLGPCRRSARVRARLDPVLTVTEGPVVTGA